MTALTFDLNNSIKSRYITLKNNSINEITFKNDAEGQIKIRESGSKIILTVYKTENGTYNYKKFVDSYKKIDNENYELLTTKYEYNKNNGNWEIKENTILKIVNKNNVPDDVINSLDEKPQGTRQIYCRYIQNFIYDKNNIKSSLEKDYLANSATEHDNSYKTNVILPSNTYDAVLTNKVLAKITIANGARAESLSLTTDKNENYGNLFDRVFAPSKSGNKYSGTYLNETVTQSSKNETFTLKKGNDEIIYDFNFGSSRTGNDKINLVKGENLTLNLLNCFGGDSEVTPTFSKKGNNLIIKFTKFQTLENKQTLTTNLGKITVKNYFKIAKDNLFIKYDDDDETLKSVKDILEFTDGVGFVGNSETVENQTLTGNFVNQVIYGGRGFDTIKGGAGYNVIFAGKGDDKIYGGKEEDNLVFYSGDGFYEDDLHNGDLIYGLTDSDSLNFYDYKNSKWTVENNLNNFTFEKSGNNFIIYHDGRDETSRAKDKYTIVNHFKTNNRLKLINGVDISQNLVNVSQEAKGKVYGSEYNDFITLTGKATISTGAGDDTLYLRKNTNDTINLTGSGVKKSLFLNTEDPAKFTKTVNFKNQDANLKISFPYADENNRTYVKSGNNLIIGLKNTDFTTENPQYNKNPEQKYVIKNYFSTKDNNDKYSFEDNISVILPQNEQTEVTTERSLKDEINKFKLIQIGKKNKSSKYNDTCYNDVIMGGIYKDTYNIFNGGDDIIYDSKGNDVYKVANLRNALEIYDFQGKDTLNITNVNDLSIYFDVTINQERKVSYTGSDFKIFDKTLIKNNKITGGVTIHNFLGKVKDFKATTGKGYIESINLGVNKLSVNVNSIANTVANWLGANGYTSSGAVFTHEKNEGDIIKLINVYTTGRPD